MPAALLLLLLLRATADASTLWFHVCLLLLLLLLRATADASTLWESIGCRGSPYLQEPSMPGQIRRVLYGHMDVLLVLAKQMRVSVCVCEGGGGQHARPDTQDAVRTGSWTCCWFWPNR